MKLWIAAYSIHMREWTYGGSSKDYAQEHCDLFQVPANSGDAAVKFAKSLRSKHLALTSRQRAVLRDLHDAVATEAKPLIQWIEVGVGEERIIERLSELQLVTPDDTGHEVRLTALAFNPSIRAKLLA